MSLPKIRSVFLLFLIILISELRADIWEERAGAVRNAVAHAWRSYKETSYYSDEVRPLSHTGMVSLFSRVTFYDSLDTLYLVGLKEEFNEALDEIISTGMPETSVFFPTRTFEFHIRYEMP
jgi:mannosyl-oligosaccharide alpha-1,2-mannosidase